MHGAHDSIRCGSHANTAVRSMNPTGFAPSKVMAVEAHPAVPLSVFRDHLFSLCESRVRADAERVWAAVTTRDAGAAGPCCLAIALSSHASASRANSERDPVTFEPLVSKDKAAAIVSAMIKGAAAWALAALQECLVKLQERLNEKWAHLDSWKEYQRWRRMQRAQQYMDVACPGMTLQVRLLNDTALQVATPRVSHCAGVTRAGCVWQGYDGRRS